MAELLNMFRESAWFSRSDGIHKDIVVVDRQDRKDIISHTVKVKVSNTKDYYLIFLHFFAMLIVILFYFFPQIISRHFLWIFNRS
jgi:hypothetical protein